MKVTTPAVGASIEITIGQTAKEEHYMAQVLDETPVGLILSEFEAGDKDFTPNPQTPIKVRFHDPSGGFEFTSVVLHKKESPVKFVYIAKPLAVTKRQLRAYLRIDCDLPVTLVRQDDHKRTNMPGTIVNISGGGCVVRMKTSLAPETMVELKFALGEEGSSANLSARILKVLAGSEGEKDHRMQFEAIDDETRTAIIRYTFKLQHAAKRAQKG